MYVAKTCLLGNAGALESIPQCTLNELTSMNTLYRLYLDCIIYVALRFGSGRKYMEIMKDIRLR